MNRVEFSILTVGQKSITWVEKYKKYSFKLKEKRLR